MDHPNRVYFWAPDRGTVSRHHAGWYGSRSGYEHVVLEPSVGPFKTAKQAMRAFEEMRLT